MESLSNIIKTLGVTRLITMGVVLVLLMGLIIGVSTRVSDQNMGLLYGGLETQEAGQIVTRLENMGVNYEVRGDSQIFVPQDRVGRLRMQLASEGLVGSSTTGYEIFDEASSFGTTALVQDINARRALEGELARTITSLPVIKGARVHIVLPKRQLFSRNETKATASVTIDIGNRMLEETQIRGIVQMVAAAVPDLMPDSVTVVDNRGDLLSAAGGTNKNQAGTTPADRFRQKLENEYEQRITQMLERVVGRGSVSAKVSAQVNFDRVEENAEIFDPEGQVARSEQLIEERTQREQTQPGAPAGLAANVPGGEDDGGTQIGSNEDITRLEETVNYEITRTVRNLVREGGEVEGLSVAVLVEGDYVTVDGERQYVPIDEERRGQLESLVRTAIGFEPTRGDKIELIDMPFKAMEEVEMVEPPLLSKEDIMRLVEYGLMFLGFILLIVFVVRPVMKAAKPQTVEVPKKSGEEGEEGIEADEGDNETMIDLAKVEGRVRESTIKKVTEIIDNNPEQSVAVVRSWLSPDKSAESSEE